MPFDGITAFAVQCELEKQLLGGRIDKIYQPEADEVILNIRSQGKMQRLLLTANASHARLHLTEQKPETPLQPPMFCMLFRKHFTGGKILSIAQHHFDRIIEIRVEVLNELGDLCHKSIVAEIMGKHSNLILVDERGQIIDSVRHVNPLMSSVRSVQPGLVYQLPAHNQKANPLELMPKGQVSFGAVMQSYEGALEKGLYQLFNGLSPLAAREVLTRAHIEEKTRYQELSPEQQGQLRASLEQLLEQLEAAQGPYLLYQDENGRAVDFSVVPYQTMQGSRIKEFDTLSALMDVFYARSDVQDKMKQKSQELRHLITTNLERAVKKQGLQEKQMADTKGRELDRIKGELITANLYQLKKGMTRCQLANYYEEGAPAVDIHLDVNLTPAQNAQKYYARYNKQKRTEEALNTQLALTREEVQYLESILTALTLADCEKDIEDIRAELYQTGYIKKAHKVRKNLSVSQPISFVTTEGVKGLIGKNNMQNDQLTFKTASAKDEWFHVKDMPGSHVILLINGLEEGRDYTEESLKEAAAMAALHSKGAGGNQVPVDHTQRRYVKKPAGSKPGFVIYTHQQTIYVKAQWMEQAGQALKK
ncbi:MAG: fibronectin/fibrinogen-binding protein [Lachnospiraceae bacterium]|jgi:predicted ribosome quality control (RQC) complex YloA/Tae2 family protein|nr:fibronectin/fibrinogen-binding protein [Lachnospiraceae bacterium]